MAGKGKYKSEKQKSETSAAETTPEETKDIENIMAITDAWDKITKEDKEIVLGVMEDFHSTILNAAGLN